MDSKKIPQISRAAIIYIIMLITTAVSVATADETYNLDNGMQVILKESHAAPMISSLIFVKSGSKYETRYENGATHFLEHLLFNGTANLSQNELDASVSDLGGYINAFTRKELTTFLVLLPKQYIDYGLTVQADMLFNSAFPEKEFAMERKIVIEEINSSDDYPDAAAEDFFTTKAYAGTSYDRPVLGYASFIENIPRKAIIDYWKKHYIPKNMTLMVIGDFEPSSIKKTIESIFGGYENPNLTKESDSLKSTTHNKFAEHKKDSNSLSGQNIFDTVANVSSTHIDFSIDAPNCKDSDYPAMDLLAEYLASDEISPLTQALTSDNNPLVTELSVSLVPHAEFSRLEISAITKNANKADTIVKTVLAQLAALKDHVADSSSIQGIKTSIRCDDIYNSARLHYYGFIISSYMMSTGWDYIKTRPERISQIEWAECQDVANKWLYDPNFIATIVKPLSDSGDVPFVPESISAEEVIAHFDTTTFPEYELIKGHKIEYPVPEFGGYEFDDPGTYHKEILPNGLTLIVKSLPGNRVFAMNVLGKFRSANENPQQAGITDFVNRCLEKGTTTRNARQLADDLALIGANLTLYDNPWIPYDNRYTTRRFSFLKFETLDEFARKGLELFSEIAFEPSFDSVEIENVRRSMMAVLGRKTGSPRNVARNSFFESLFDGKAFSQPVMGSPKTIGTISQADLKQHHTNFYSPENVIVTIVTGKQIDTVIPWARDILGSRPPTGFISNVPKPPVSPSKTLTTHTELDKEQITIYLGEPMPGANSKGTSALTIASSILSERLYLALRERDGLAYSVGSSITFDRNFGWHYCSIATASENYQKALDGILFQIDKLQLDGPTASELQRAKNSIWGHLMSAKLAAINQAYYLSVNDYLGHPMEFDKQLLTELEGVTADDIRQASSRFLTSNYIIATAGKLPK
ncbi:MAG: pitrilysin family protein [candidate division Zixibacteria bacterium]|nr:pitrilysin family protein [candidate division Zixibacteria bacterium]